MFVALVGGVAEQFKEPLTFRHACAIATNSSNQPTAFRSTKHQDARRLRSELWEERSAAASAAVVAAGELGQVADKFKGLQ